MGCLLAVKRGSQGPALLVPSSASDLIIILGLMQKCLEIEPNNSHLWLWLGQNLGYRMCIVNCVFTQSSHNVLWTNVYHRPKAKAIVDCTWWMNKLKIFVCLFFTVLFCVGRSKTLHGNKTHMKFVIQLGWKKCTTSIASRSPVFLFLLCG